MQQAAACLRDLGVPASIYYTDQRPDPVPPRFRKYAVPWVTAVDDCERNVLVLPETLLGIAREYVRTRRYAWWMSVDNYLNACSLPDALRNLTYLPAILKSLVRPVLRCLRLRCRDRFSSTWIRLRDASLFDLHLYQSEYARRFLLKNGIRRVQRLSDYINEEFLSDDTRVAERANRVLYNPRKGCRYTQRLISLLPGIEWLALEQMTPSEMRSAMRSSKVYADFGHHPGKDRIPREAAANGCVVIVGKRGSAQYDEDLPIGEDFKFGTSRAELHRASRCIGRCLEDYDRCVKEQDRYRGMIRGEKSLFIADIKGAFGVP